MILNDLNRNFVNSSPRFLLDKQETSGYASFECHLFRVVKMTSAILPNSPLSTADGIRPINLKTDLAQLADLIELVFADSMDSSGMAAVREMRYISKWGVGLGLLAGSADLTNGISLGYVYIVNGHLVGNVSVYPVNWPDERGKVWVVANVGVHPNYQRRGIAAQLMHSSMDLIRSRGGQIALLQVDTHNDTAHRLYLRLGFVDERPWTLWRRHGSGRLPPPLDNRTLFISRRRRSEWREEYNLARSVRPAYLGGMGWQRPLHTSLFRKSLAQHLSDWINLRSEERLVIRSEDEDRMLASLWISNAFLASSTQLTLMVDPAYYGLYDEALINLAVRTVGGGRNTLMIEHPSDETVTNEVLSKYHFRPQRETITMRWDVN